MTEELSLQVPLSLLFSLNKQATRQGVSLEALCLSLLSESSDEGDLIDPSFYPSLNHGILRSEIAKVIESSLPQEEIKRRVNHLEFQISRRYIR
jgi:hypothetical protein